MVGAKFTGNFYSPLKCQLVRTALRECNGSRSEAAARLKIARQYLYRLINELQISEDKDATSKE